MADENLPNQLPLDWVLDSKKKKDGIEVMFYTNVKTGQKFSTKEDLFQYINYTRTTLPLLNAGWTMNLEGKLQPPGEGVMHKAVGESSSLAPDAQLKGQPVLETEKQEERSTSKPGSKKYKRKNKRQDSK